MFCFCYLYTEKLSKICYAEINIRLSRFLRQLNKNDKGTLFKYCNQLEKYC